MNGTCRSGLAIVVGFFLGLTGVTSAFAGETRDVAGYDILSTTTAEVTELGGGHSMMIWNGTSVIASDDHSSPFHLTAGNCSGVLEFFPDDTVQTSGYCTRKDKDGDVHSLRWGQERGAEKGTWEMTSGTGKWEGVTGGGWYQDTMAEGDMSATVYGGTVTLK